MARILAVEPFYGGSHRSFLDGLVANSRHDFTLLTLPGDRWRTRMRRGWQDLAEQALSLPGEFDALIATDMLDLASFLAATRRRFVHTPVLLYFHENQFTYPRLRGERLNSWFGAINYRSALVADRVAFNSDFHRADFARALRTLEGTTANWIVPGAADAIDAKAGVLPIGMDLVRFDAHETAADSDPPLVLWNHRWEFDKEPGLFVRAIEQLDARGLPFRVVITGEPGDAPSDALERLRARLPHRIEHAGYVESFANYARLLWRSKVAVSTSRQEFFGIAMAEAMYCCCHPVAPHRLNYPYLIPRGLHDAALFTDEAGLVDRIAAALAAPHPAATARSAVAGYDWSQAAPVWDRSIAELCRFGSTRPQMRAREVMDHP